MRAFAAAMLVALTSFALPSRADEGFGIALKLARNNLLCSNLYGAVVLDKGPSRNPSSEMCAFGRSVVKTKNGLRLLLVYSFIDEHGRPEMHSVGWVDVDCVDMLTRYSDGYLSVASKTISPSPSRQKRFFQLENGWKVASYLKGRGEWESLKSDVVDRAKIKTCSLFLSNNR